jgi:hypothetical protein
MRSVDDLTWLQRTYYQETLKIFTRVWDLYVKFYTVFLTVNILGLGLALQHIDRGNRLPVVLAFVLQNVLTMGTSLVVAHYSIETDKKLIRLTSFLQESGDAPRAAVEALQGSPVPTKLARYAAYANCVASACLIVCWIVVNHI